MAFLNILGGIGGFGQGYMDSLEKMSRLRAKNSGYGDADISKVLPDVTGDPMGKKASAGMAGLAAASAGGNLNTPKGAQAYEGDWPGKLKPPGKGGITGRTSIAQIEKDPQTQEAIANFAQTFPNVKNPKEQLYRLISGESTFGKNMFSGQYAGYFQLGHDEAYGPMGLTKRQFAALPLHEQLNAYSRWAQKSARQQGFGNDQLRDLGLFNAASNLKYQTAPPGTVVYHSTGPESRRGIGGGAREIDAVRQNAASWGAHSGRAGGDITVGGISSYYNTQQLPGGYRETPMAQAGGDEGPGGQRLSARDLQSPVDVPQGNYGLPEADDLMPMPRPRPQARVAGPGAPTQGLPPLPRPRPQFGTPAQDPNFPQLRGMPIQVGTPPKGGGPMGGTGGMPMPPGLPPATPQQPVGVAPGGPAAPGMPPMFMPGGPGAIQPGAPNAPPMFGPGGPGGGAMPGGGFPGGVVPQPPMDPRKLAMLTGGPAGGGGAPFPGGGMLAGFPAGGPPGGGDPGLGGPTLPAQAPGMSQVPIPMPRPPGADQQGGGQPPQTGTFVRDDSPKGMSIQYPGGAPGPGQVGAGPGGGAGGMAGLGAMSGAPQQGGGGVGPMGIPWGAFPWDPQQRRTGQQAGAGVGPMGVPWGAFPWDRQFQGGPQGGRPAPGPFAQTPDSTPSAGPTSSEPAPAPDGRGPTFRPGIGPGSQQPSEEDALEGARGKYAQAGASDADSYTGKTRLPYRNEAELYAAMQRAYGNLPYNQFMHKWNIAKEIFKNMQAQEKQQEEFEFKKKEFEYKQKREERQELVEKRKEEEYQREHITYDELSPARKKFIDHAAERWAVGGPKAAFGGWTTRGKGSVAHDKQLVEERAYELHPEIDPKDFPAKWMGYETQRQAKQAAQMRSMNMVSAGYGAQRIMPRLHQSAAAANPTEIPTVNAAFRWFAEHTGKDLGKYAQMKVDMESLVRMYAQVLQSRGNMIHVSDVEAARIIQQNWGGLTIDDAMDRMRLDIQSEEQAVNDLQETMKLEITNFKPIPDFRDAPEGGGGGGGGFTPKVPEGLPVDQLREGEETEFENGQVWTLKDGKPSRVK